MPWAGSGARRGQACHARARESGVKTPACVAQSRRRLKRRSPFIWKSVAISGQSVVRPAGLVACSEGAFPSGPSDCWVVERCRHSGKRGPFGISVAGSRGSGGRRMSLRRASPGRACGRDGLRFGVRRVDDRRVRPRGLAPSRSASLCEGVCSGLGGRPPRELCETASELPGLRQHCEGELCRAVRGGIGLARPWRGYPRLQAPARRLPALRSSVPRGRNGTRRGRTSGQWPRCAIGEVRDRPRRLRGVPSRFEQRRAAGLGVPGLFRVQPSVLWLPRWSGAVFGSGLRRRRVCRRFASLSGGEEIAGPCHALPACRRSVKPKGRRGLRR